jgi:hypothetical protein
MRLCENRSPVLSSPLTRLLRLNMTVVGSAGLMIFFVIRCFLRICGDVMMELDDYEWVYRFAVLIIHPYSASFYEVLIVHATRSM